MITLKLDKPLTNLQIELLKIFSKELPEKNLLELKDLISDFLLDKAMDEADKAWEKNEYNTNDINNWLGKNERK